MIWQWWLSSVYIVTYRSAFDDYKILGIYSTFEKAAIIVDRLIQFREIQNSECVTVHRAYLNGAQYDGLKDLVMRVNQYGANFTRDRYEKLYHKLQTSRQRSVNL